jgi:hypothetical protein
LTSIIISLVAAAISACSLAVSILTYRSSGSRVEVLGHEFEIRGTDLWLSVKVSNSGRGEVDIDGATCDALGATTTQLPYRLKSGSSQVLSFRAGLAPLVLTSGSVTVAVGLGTGRVLTAQLRMTDETTGQLRSMRDSLASGAGAPTPLLRGLESNWTPPRLEEV